MKNRLRLLCMVAIGLGLLGGLVLFGGKPAPNIQLRATFRGETLPGAQGELFYVDKICNDALGPYVTNSKKGVSVWFTPDAGDLFFKFEHHSNRSAVVVFPNVSTPCGYLPDTAGVYPELPDDPVDFFRFVTHNSPAYNGPQLNFLQMTPGIHYTVRLWITICSTTQHYFLLNYNDPDPSHLSGLVDVVAYASSGKLVRWEMTPIPGTGDIAYIYKWPEGNDQAGSCFYTSSPMPFKLVLERLN